MKHELRFRTKWEGLSAAGLGLTPEQLQLLELKAEQIKCAPYEVEGVNDGRGGI
jgi:hypothetical protein